MTGRRHDWNHDPVDNGLGGLWKCSMCGSEHFAGPESPPYEYELVWVGKEVISSPTLFTCEEYAVHSVHDA